MLENSYFQEIYHKFYQQNQSLCHDACTNYNYENKITVKLIINHYTFL